MPSADGATARFAVHSAGRTPDSSGASCPATRVSRTRSSEGTWEIRRAIVRARSALISMRLEEVSRATAHLKRLLSERPDPHLARYAFALRILEASTLAAADDFSTARSLLTNVPAHTGDTLAATVLRYLDWRDGERREDYAPDTADYLVAPVGGKAVCRILSLCVSAGLAFDRLQLAVSARLATEALQLARLRYGSHSPMSAFPATLLAQVAYEQGNLEEAEALLRPRLSVIRTSGILECIARASVLLARVSLHRGRHRAGLEILRETEALGRARRWPRLVSIAASEYARALESLRYDEGHGSANQTPKGKAHAVLLESSRRASIIAKSSRPPAQLGMYSQPSLAKADLGTACDDDAVSFSAVEATLARICACASHSSIDAVYELLIPWLRIGIGRGLCMTFVDAGRPLLTLLEGFYHVLPLNHPQLSDLRPYVATLLRFRLDANTEEPSSLPYRPLSRRETGILQLIAHGMSNKRIAQSLGITPETVKSHAKSIFVKLATRTRAQAVARAEAIGFL
jgi:DNA-binding CsgD family transcriptional regulator